MEEPASSTTAGGAGWLEVLGILRLILVWPVGAVLLWFSRVWSTRDKLIGVLVPPGGYPVMMPWIMLLLRLRAVCYGGTYDLDCVFIILVMGALVLPIVSALYLAREAWLPAPRRGAVPPLLITAGVVGGITIVTGALTAGVELGCR